MDPEHLFIPVQGAKLEAVLDIPEGRGPFPGVVICHPHPHYGGSMDNNVVWSLCEGIRHSGIVALRFNYRGIGLSEGTSAADALDVEDAASILRYLSERPEVDRNCLGIGGYSFGGSVSLKIAAEKSFIIRAVASIACPISTLSDPKAQASPIPKLLIGGTRDRIVPIADFQKLSQLFCQPREVRVIDGADHFFLARENLLGDLVGRFFADWLALTET